MVPKCYLSLSITPCSSFVKEKRLYLLLFLLNNSQIYCVFFYVLTGTSDPYVKFKIAGKEVFRSKTIHKNLNPVWEEKVSLLVESLREPLYVKVNDKKHFECFTPVVKSIM